MQIITINEAKMNLSKLIAQAAKGAEVVISKSGKPVAKLVSVVTQPKKRTPGLLKGKIWMAPDFTDEDQTMNQLFYGEE